MKGIKILSRELTKGKLCPLVMLWLGNKCLQKLFAVFGGKYTMIMNTCPQVGSILLPNMT